ncbi:MAG: glycoside hydrolase family 25 protein [Roseiarcus sp.]
MTLSLPASSRILVRLAAVAALSAALIGCSGGVGPLDFDDGYPKPADYPIHGIDVSKYQGTIDWNAVANSGVGFVWIKATEGGDYRDERFQANWEGAKQAGIPHGAYHFMYWCRPAIEEATWFDQNVPVEADALPPVLDVEPTPDSRTCKRRLEREPTIADMKVMLDEMERHYGKRPIIYTSLDFYRAILSDGAFADYPIWVRSTKHNPAVPYGSREWKFWQYRADGAIPGIDGAVDRNAFYGTREQWQAFLDGSKRAGQEFANSSAGALTAPLGYSQPQEAPAPSTTVEASRQAVAN